LTAQPGALTGGANQALLLQVVDDLAGGVLGEIDLPREIGLRRLAEPPQRGQDHPLIELSDDGRIAALAVGHTGHRGSSEMSAVRCCRPGQGDKVLLINSW
jgi:hypothetical protein